MAGVQPMEIGGIEFNDQLKVSQKINQKNDGEFLFDTKWVKWVVSYYRKVYCFFVSKPPFIPENSSFG